MPRPAYVEDAPDVDIPPAAPSPPPAVPAQPVQPVNVFDFLVAENTPNASRVSLGGSHEQMAMKKGAHSIFSGSQNGNQDGQTGHKTGEEQAYDEEYEEHGFTYGTEPVRPSQFTNHNGSIASLDFMTPAAKATRAQIERSESLAHSRTDSGLTSDKKRKRGSPEALDLSAIHNKGNHHREVHADTPMADAPPSSADTPSLNHSGLTGGLNRLLTDPRDPFPPTPDYSDEKEYAREVDQKIRPSRADYPGSPLKRSRHSKGDTSINSGLGLSIKGRAGRVMSLVGSTSAGGGFSVLNPAGMQNKETALVKVRRRNSLSEDGQRGGSREGRKVERKKYKVQRPVSMLSAVRSDHGQSDKHSSNASNTSRRRRGSNESPDPRRRKVKAIEYHPHHHHHKHTTASDSNYTDDEDDSNTSHRHRHRSVSNNSSTRPRGGAGAAAAAGGEMVVFGEEQRLKMRAESFLSFVTKGPDSERGCSVNKALKRWHREGAGTGTEFTGSKEEEQKELWRGLRLRRNERGEIVVFC